MQMATKEEMHEFAIYWLEKYPNAKTSEAEAGKGFAEMCLSLGFQMDTGKSLEKVFPDTDAFNDDYALARMIGQVNDAKLLGPAILAKWKHITHGASFANALFPENRSWLIIALSRMAVLTSADIDGPSIFGDKVKRLRIVSNNLGYGLAPALKVEVEQRLTIAADGRVWFSGYHFGKNYQKYERGRTHNFHVDQQSAICILTAVGKYFSNDYETFFATDCGCWEMTITTTKGNAYRFTGSLCADFVVNG